MSKMITTHSARVAEIIRHKQKQRRREAQDKAWRRLRHVGVGVSRDRVVMPQPTHQANFLYDFLPDNAWAGQRCFIVGGGASLRGFDFSRLRGEKVIGVNRAFEFCECDILLAMDRSVYTLALQGKPGETAEVIHERRLRFEQCEGYKVWLDGTVPNVYYLRNYGESGLSPTMRDGLATGGNTGYAALNLVLCLGANPIYLLGFDMRGDGKGGQAWFHDGYPVKQGENVYDKFRAYFEATAPEIQKRGVKVINLNPESRLKSFAFGSIDDIKDLGNRSIYFDGCLGFGDNFQQRPIIRNLARCYRTVYVRTAFPEAYWDIPGVRFVKPEFINLRTQKKHMAGLTEIEWTKSPAGTDTLGWRQCWPAQSQDFPRSIAAYVKQNYGGEDYDFMFPLKRTWLAEARKIVDGLDLRGKKLCIIRQPTQRREWASPARSPRTEYFQLLIDRYREEYFFLNIADIAEGEEWFEHPLQGIDAEFIRGELPITTALALMKLADMTITYPSLFMYAGMALRAKCFTIFGGELSPMAYVDPIMSLGNFGHVAPEPFCNCLNQTHDCRKDIPAERILAGFEELRARPRAEKVFTVGVPPGLGDVHWVLTKMESFRERNGIDRLRIAVCEDKFHKYTSQYLGLVPFVDEVEKRSEHFKIGVFYGPKPFSFIRNYQNTDMLIDFGAEMFLRGKRIADIMPEYEPHYDFEVRLPEDAEKFASDLCAANPAGLVLFYTSAIGNNDNWNKGNWTFQNWMTLAEKIHSASGARPILIGAYWDKDYATELKRFDKGDILQDMVGTTDIPQIIAVIRRARLMCSFPCGLPMIAVYACVPTVLFWPIKEVSTSGRFHKDFMCTWLPPGTEDSGRYIPLAYGGPETTPDHVFDRVRQFL